MGNGYIESSLKRYLKRKVKITLGLVVSFLITGMVSFAENIINEKIEIKFENGNIVVTPEGVGKLEDNTWTFDDTIDVQNSNGVNVSSLNENFNIINNGSISASSESGNHSGNGFYGGGKQLKINLTNNGTILGSSSSSGTEEESGNGGYNYDGRIENLTNNGIISGNNKSAKWLSGNGFLNRYGDIGNLINNSNGIISGSSENGDYSGNGFINTDRTIKKLINYGTISGSSKSGNHSGNGIVNTDTIGRDYDDTLFESLINYGTISGSGSGICNDRRMGDLTNNGIIFGNKSGIYNYDGTKIYKEIATLTNNGIISSHSIDNNIHPIEGNGISNAGGTIGTLTNNGTISGSGNGFGSGNGIINRGEESGLLTNDGTILGSSSGTGEESGNGIINSGKGTEILTNDGTISGSSENGNESGNGIYSIGKIGILTNNGTISGGRDGDYSKIGNGIHNSGSKIESLFNYGNISGSGGSNSGNGISNAEGVIGTLTNNGSISGSSGTGNHSGSGIYIYGPNATENTIGTLTNNGIISASNESGSYSGNGIYNRGKIGTLTNNGIISGSSGGGDTSGNGIFNYQEGKISYVNNYGIIAGSGRAILNYLTTEFWPKNFGLLINKAGKDNQEILASENKEAGGKYIINGVESLSNKVTAKAINSSELKNEISEDKRGSYFDETKNKYQDLVINVVGDKNNSLNIDSDFNISKSTINGYKNAVVLNGGTFTGDNIIVNAGENAFIGSNSNDSLNFSNESAVNGDINLGAGEDKIAFDNSAFTGDITGDSDILSFKNSKINGKLNLTGGKLDLVSSNLNGDLTLTNNTVNLAESSTANGNININGGDNTLSGTTETNLFNTGMGIINGDITINSGSLKIQDKLLINGDIDFNNTAGTIFIGKDFSKELFNGKILNSSNALLGIEYKIDESTDYTGINNQLEMFDEIKKLKLNDEGNTINLSKITTSFTGISGGAGDDTFKVSVDELEKLDSLNGGVDDNKTPYKDNDTLEFTTVVDNTLSVISLKNIMNIETLKLADVNGNNLDINKSIPLVGTNLMFKNYVGGNKDDNFTVSIENFQKLSSIDGGANETAGDTLKVDGGTFTNIKSDGTIDDTVFGKIKNIENLEFGNSTLAMLNLNNLTSEYLQNLNIKLGSSQDTIDVSSDTLRNLKSISGGYGNDVLKLTDKIINKDESFEFINKNKVNSFENIYFSDKGNTINLDNLAKANDDIEVIHGGSGDDYFITSPDLLNTTKKISGEDGVDTIEITNTVKNAGVLKSVDSMEKLVLSGENNEIIVDDFINYNNGHSFIEMTGTNGGTNGNTFTINGTDTSKKDKALGMKIEGGSSANDKLIVNTEISTDQLSNKTGIENLKLGLNKEIDYNIDFTYKDQTDLTKTLEGFKNITSGNGNDTFTVSVDNIGNMTIDGGGNHNVDTLEGQDTLKLLGVLDNTISGKENILNGVSNIENLHLDNKENTLNIDNTNGFKNIYGGTEKDTFKVSAIKLGTLDRLDGGTNQIDNDILEITSGDIKDNSLEKVVGIENLVLAKDSSNDFDLDNLSFNSITKEGIGDDTFTINSNIDKLKMEINGGEGQNDTLKVNTSVNMTDKGELQNIKGIENLLVKSKDGVNNLRFSKFNINSFEHIGLDGAENNLYLVNLDKNISVQFRNENTDKNNLTVNDDNSIFNHTVIGSNNINLYAKDKNTEWTFGKDSRIMTNNKNTNINTDGIFNLGNIVSGKDGFTVNEDFIEGNATLNGDVKFTISKGITFALDKLYNFSFSKLSLGADKKIILPEFLKTQEVNQKDFTFKVKNWQEYTSVAQNLDFMTYEGRYKEAVSKYNKDTAITNAFNSFTEDTIFNYVTDDMGDKLVYYSDEDTKPYGVKVTGEDIIIKTNPDKSKDQNLNLAFNNISSTGDINIEATGGVDNTVTFGNGEGTSVIISSGDKDNLSVINGINSTENLTLNFNGATNKVDRIVIDNQFKNSINIKGDTEVGEILLGAGNDKIYAGEDSQKLTIGNINLGSGNDTLDIRSTGEIKLSNINLGSGENNISFADTSKVKEFNVIKSDKDTAINNITITETGNNSESFNVILAGANNAVDKIIVNDDSNNTLNISKDFNGELSFAKGENTITLNKENYTGNITFTEGKNNFTVSETGSSKGTVAILGEENTINIKGTANALTVGEKNIITIDGKLSSLVFTENSDKNNITVNGTLESGITFGAASSGNIVTVSEKGSIGKDIIFGTGAGDEFNLTSSENQFAYNLENADVINLKGGSKEWNFKDGKITGEKVTVNVENGLIGFNIGKSDTGLVLGKDGVNPFAATGNYTINGDIKVTFDDTVKFTSLSDKLTGTGNISLGTKADGAKYNIIVPEFMKYDISKKEFSIKSAEELKSSGLEDYAFGNYEYAILNYNKEGYGSLTSMLNNNTLAQISSVLNKGIDEKDYYFYSDDREIKDMATIGDIYIKTSEDNKVTDKDTDIKFTNVTGNAANINFAENTTNSVSFLKGTNLSKIDGSSSKAGFTLNLNGVNIEKSQDEKDNTKVVMSDFADILNIQSELNSIGIDTGKGNDEINISSSVKNLTLNTGEGDDIINILSSVNGVFDGNKGTNTLNIGAKTQTLSDEKPKDEIVLSGEIKGFQNINLNQNAKLDSKLAITGTDTIKLNGNDLFVGVDYDKVSDNKVIGHALYDNGIKVDNSTGKVMLDTAGAKDGAVISFGKDNKSEFTEQKNILESGSSSHNIEIVDGEVVVKVNEHIMGDKETGAVEYAHLDKIYQSIVSANKIKEMSNTTTLLDKTKDEAIKGQLEFYGKIYHSTPYAYTHKISKKSAELITDSLILNDGMPELKSWRFGGSIAGREAENSENFYGNNYYNGIDVGNTEVKAETDIYGAYAFGEYGFEEGKAVGFAVAGSKSDTDINGSSLKGNNIFVSAYVKQDINNLSMIAGIGYQRGFYEADRSVSNAYQSMKVEKDFEDDTFVGYFGAKYRYDCGNNFYLEPNGELRLTHSIQDDIKEDNRGDLSIEVDNKDFTSVDGELGVNLGKKIAAENGVLNLKAGLSVSYALDGNDEEHLNARITGSSKDFEIISPEDEDRTKVNVLLKAEYQANNGMYYDLHYKTTTDNEDYSVGFGVGYKF